MRRKRFTRNVEFIWISVILVILSSINVHALGIAPSKKIIDYNTAADSTDINNINASNQNPDIIDQNVWVIDSRIINTEKRDMDVKITASGELSEYITIDNPIIHLKSTDSEKEFQYTVRLPAGIASKSPGTKTINIIISEIGSDANNALGGLLTVTQQLQVNIPYEGLYAQGYLSVSTFGIDNPATFTLNIMNMGSEDIKTVHGMFSIKDLNETTIYSKNIEGYENIVHGSSSKIEESAIFRNTGKYIAEYVIYYDNKNFTTEKEFDIGEYDIAVTGASVDNFRLGTIAKFDINISSEWNTPIDDVYGEVIIKDLNGTIIGNAQTEKAQATPDNNILTAYWDSRNIAVGNYIIGINIHAGNKVISKEYPSIIENDKIIIGQTPIKSANKQYSIYIAAALLALAAIFIISLFKKSRRRRH